MKYGAARSRVLEEAYETAAELYAAGLMSQRQLADFGTRCRTDKAPISPESIRELRRSTHLSQSVFAAVIGTSVSTVQKWEAGDKRPSGPSLKLLHLIARKGLDVVL